MEPWIALFVLFSPLWWGLMVGASCLIIWALEEDAARWAGAVVVGAILILSFFGKPSLITMINDDPWFLVNLLWKYLLVGVGFGFVKFGLYAYKQLHKYEDMKIAWLRSKGVSDRELPKALVADFKKYIIDNHYDYVNTTYVTNDQGVKEKVQTIELRPRPWNHTTKILSWMTYWPWSLFWSLFDDFIRNVFRFAQRRLTSAMDWVSKFIFRNALKDFE